MKLYWGPHTCAIGIHVLLEEIGKPYELEEIDVLGGENDKPPFIDLNPKGKVPTLVRDDGSMLTEYGAIATWLARTNPERDLLPHDLETEARCLEVMDYVVGTLHGQGFGRIFMPAKFEPPDVVHATLGLGAAKVKAQGREMVETGLGILETALAGRSYVAGDRFTVADTALFYALRWAPQTAIPLPPGLAAHYALMKQRPAVIRVMQREGEPDAP
jgi:glutathione S-transferase